MLAALALSVAAARRVNVQGLNLGAAETDTSESIEQRCSKSEETMMFHLSSRMKLPTRLIACAVLAIAGAAALSTPAFAVYVAPANTVKALCKQTGCWSDTTSNGAITYGCGVQIGPGGRAGPSSDTCFICDNKKGKCYSGRRSVVEGNRNVRSSNVMSPSLLDGGGSLPTNAPSATGQPIGGGSRGGSTAGIR